MACSACGQEERQDRKTVLGKARRLTLHRECPDGRAWHLPLVIKPGTRPAPPARRPIDGGGVTNLRCRSAALALSVREKTSHVRGASGSRGPAACGAGGPDGLRTGVADGGVEGAGHGPGEQCSLTP